MFLVPANVPPSALGAYGRLLILRVVKILVFLTLFLFINKVDKISDLDIFSFVSLVIPCSHGA